jgi:hypothetical protein
MHRSVPWFMRAPKVRCALLFYALKQLGLDVPPEMRRQSEQHIVLLNRDAIESAVVRQNET